MIEESGEESPYPERLRKRTKSFALNVVRLFQILPKSEEARVIGRQLLRSATSIAANYRAAGRARSKAEFISKIGVVLEEADETILWLELLNEDGIATDQQVGPLLREGNQLVAMFSASRRTASRQLTRSPDRSITR